MIPIAEDVWQIPLTPRNGVNAYLLGDVVVDAGMPSSVKRIVGAVAGHSVSAHALTHAHLDHAGGSARLTAQLDLPMWAPADDAEDVESGEPAVADTWARPLVKAGGGFDAVSVDRRLMEGDEVGGFSVVDAPGHSPGHVAYWRERDRVLVCGDVFFNLHPATTRYGLREPIRIFTVDPALNRRSMRKLADLEPAVALFGHGPPLRDPARLRAFVDALPAD